MIYLYRNTRQNSEVIAQFSDKDNALAYLEHIAYRDNDPDCIGFSLRDFELRTYAEIEK